MAQHAVWSVCSSSDISLAVPLPPHGVITAANRHIHTLLLDSTLRIQHSVPLHDTPTAIALLHNSILVALPHAKLAILQLDSQSIRYNTTAITQFNTTTQSAASNGLAVDHKSRCAALVLSHTQIAIVPQQAIKLNNLQLYSYVQDLAAHRIKRIKDIAFLHGYHEPTLLVLHEPYHTWEGRTAIRRNSCQLAVFSIDITRKQVSLICTSELLPYSTSKIISIPEPFGGAVILSLNQVFYFSQAIESVLSLNVYGEKHQEDYRVATTFTGEDDVFELNRSCGTLLTSSQILINSSRGQLLLLELKHQQNTVFGLQISCVGDSYPLSCMCRISGNHVFLGSKISDSVLLRYDTADDDASKSEGLKSDVDELIEDNDKEDIEILFYGRRLNISDENSIEKDLMTSKQSNRYLFKEVDRLINISPQVSSTIGISVIDDHGQRNLNLKPYDCFVDYVSCSGYQNSSSISVLETGIRSNLLNSVDFQLPVVGSWCAKRPGSDKDYLLAISFHNSTIMFLCEGDLKSFTSPAFLLNGRTIALGNVCSNELIVQVHLYGVYLIDAVSGRRIQQLIIGDEFQQLVISQARILDNYVLLLLNNQTVQLLVANETEKQITIEIPQLYSPSSNFPQFEQSKDQVTAIALYKDLTGCFKCFPQTDRTSLNQMANESLTYEESKDAVMSDIAFENTDDLQSLFFGENANSVESENDERLMTEAQLNTDGMDITSKDSCYCILSRADGRLEIYLLPNFTPVFWCSSFSVGYKYYENHFAKPSFTVSPFDEVVVDEICVSISSNINSGLPYIVSLLSNGDLLVYRFYKFEIDSGLGASVRLAKFNHSIILKEATKQSASESRSDESVEENEQSNVQSSLLLGVSENVKTIQKVHYFENVAGYSGFFIDGSRPVWLFECRDYLFPHYEALRPVNGVIPSFTNSFFSPFNSESCENGFLRFYDGTLEIRQLPIQGSINYDCMLPTRKIPLNQTVRYIAYSLETHTYVLGMSEEKETFSLEESSKRSPKVFDEEFELALMTSGNFKIVDRYRDFNPKEVILTMKVMTLYKDVMSRSETSDEGSSYLVVGTSSFDGEESLCRGRILMFEIYDTSPSDTSGSGMKFKFLFDMKEKGPVTAMENVMGLLCVTVGNRIIMYHYDGEVLNGCAFIDADFYIVTMSSVKNFLVVGDLCKSITLVYWDHEFQQLMFLGKDYSECHSLCSGFVLGVGGELSVLLSDVSGNLQLFASRGGKRLVLVGDYSLGWRCTSSSILQLQPAGGGGYVTLLSGDSGTISLLIPVDESTYRRLYSLHTQLTFKLHHACGLNPKQSRSSSRSSVRNVVDADLLKEYVSLDYYQRRKLARNIGTNCAQILENLLRFDQSLTGF